MCDLRMGEISNSSSEIKIKNAFLKTSLKNSEFYFHSSSNKRGVAMFIKKSLGLVPIISYKDQDENVLIIKFRKNEGGGEYALVVYTAPTARIGLFTDSSLRYY
jgi:hypothetical protein